MRETETFTCGFCHQEHPISERHFFDDTELCEACYRDETTTCDHCGNRIWVEEDCESDGYTTLCANCYNRYYTRCTECERILHYDDACYSNGDDDPYCCNCVEHVRSNRKHIHSYCYKPAPIFYGEGTRFFGVELELDDGGECDVNAAALIKIANESAEHIYCKHDGSLDEGFEIVTYPMSLSCHMHQMPWAHVMEEAVRMDYRSHQSGTCGLHIHVNRDTFGQTEAEQEAAVARVLFFVENHWNELLRFSRRTRSQMEQWAARYGRKDNPKDQLEHVKSSFTDRYRAVNLTNNATIEFRMFRGTLRYNTLIATLQFVNEICDLACYLSDDEMANLTWSDFCSRVGSMNYPELVQYLKERRLYVSDPVETEVEI